MKIKRYKKNLSLFLVLLLYLTGCTASVPDSEATNSESDSEAANSESETSSGSDEGITTIVWSMRTDACEFNVDLLNEKLLEDGYSLQLEVDYLAWTSETDNADYEEAQKSVQEKFLDCFSNNTTDIVSMGSYGNDKISELIRDGKLYDLTDYLESEEGKSLWNAFYDGLWETVKVDGTICLIPTQVGVDGANRCIFNKEYFKEEDLDGFDGTYYGLLQLLEYANIENPQVLMETCSASDLAMAAGQQYLKGVLLDFETGEVTTLYENEDFMEQVDAIRTMYEHHYFGEQNESISSLLSMADQAQDLEFTVWVCADVSSLYESLEDDVITVQMPYALVNRLNCSVGINNQSEHIAEALELLTLLYTNEEYINLLVWGEEDTDYTMTEEGYAVALSDRAMDVSAKEWNLGMFDLIIPQEGDDFITDRAAAKQSLYEGSGRCDSVVTAFCPDYSEIGAEISAYSDTAEELLDQYIRCEIDLEEFRSGLEAAGAEDAKALFQVQMSAYME